MGTLFVTSTGTDIGKTFVSAGLIRHWRREGRAVEALKPVMSGYDPQQTATSDAGCLLRALGHTIDEPNVARIAPWRYRAPLAPDLAAAKEGRTLDVESLVAFCRERMGANDDTLLIEGVGGIMVPLDETKTVLDWMVALAAPVLLVTGSYLGTISHTLTALTVLELSRLDVRAIAVSDRPGSTVELADTVDTLERFGRGVPVVGIPRLASGEAEHPAFAELAVLLN
ncbi:MAG: dethiobiotin synthase [Pseudolabrys sp.]